MASNKDRHNDPRAGEPRIAAARTRASGEVLPGSLASLETTLPPTPLKKLLAADGASVYVFSSDDTLLGTVQEAGGEQYPVHALDDWPTLLAAIDRGACRIVLLDADTLGSDLEDRIVELRGLEPGLVILLAAPRDTAQRLIGLLSDRSVHRLVIKPAAAGITRLLLESAVSRYLQLREDSTQSLEAQIESLRRRQPQRETTRWPAWILATALVSLLIGAVIVGGVARLGPSAPAPPSSADATTGSEAVAASVAAGESVPVGTVPGAATPAADAEGGSNQSTAPVATSASSSAAGAGRPGSEGAGESGEGPGSDARSADAEQRDAPDRGLSAAAANGPASTAGDDTAAGVAPEQAAPGSSAAALRAAATASAEPAAQAQDPVAALLARASLARVGGGVAEPVGDSALDHYAAILAEDPNHVEANEALAEILDTLFAQAEAALLVDDFDAAETVLGHIRRIRPNGTGRLAFMLTQLERARAATVASVATSPAASAQSNAADALLSPGVALRPNAVDAGAASATPVTESTPPAASPAAVTASDRELDSLLTIAVARLDRGQLLEPAGDSAQAYLERAQALEADNPRVLALRSRLANAVVSDARIVLNAGDIERASNLAAAAFRLGADTELMAVLEIDLANAREQQTAAARRQTYTAGLQRLRQGALTTPAGDSAIDHLSRLRSERPDYPGLAPAWLELTDSIGEQVQTAIDAEDWPAAEARIATLTEFEADAGLIAELDDELTAARRQVEYLSVVAPASELALVEYEPPEYPSLALRTNTEGWAEIQFVVDRQGTTRDLVVVQAEPEGRFEEAALESVATYRYIPFELEGRVYERLVRLRIRFALE